MASQSFTNPLSLVQSDNSCQFLDSGNPFVIEGLDMAPAPRRAKENCWAIAADNQPKPAPVSSDEKDAFSCFLVLPAEQRHNALVALDAMTADEAIEVLGNCFNELQNRSVKPTLLSLAACFSEQQTAAEHAAILYAMVNFDTLWLVSRNQTSNVFAKKNEQPLSLSA